MLTGKVALITGGAHGIGLGIARALVEKGARVALLDIDDDAGGHEAKRMRDAGGDARYFRCDVESVEAVRSVVTHVIGQFGGLDILVNNVGVHNAKGIEDCSEEGWESVININLRSAFLMTKYALPALKESRGCVINVASMVGVVGQKASVAYAASKGGMIAFTKAVALDVGGYGIRVNAICPGFVDTPMLDKWIETQENPAETRAALNDMHPLGRIAEAEEIGRTVAHLAGPDASFTTGAIIRVDGGVTLGY